MRLSLNHMQDLAEKGACDLQDKVHVTKEYIHFECLENNDVKNDFQYFLYDFHELITRTEASPPCNSPPPQPNSVEGVSYSFCTPHGCCWFLLMLVY